jgi:5'-nucleotidase (lipoprotein e(P4) family)
MKRWLVWAVLLAGCRSAGSAGPAGPGPVAVAPATDPPAVHWTRTAAEHRAVFVQTYAWAEQRVREQTAGRSASTWAVILDADETVIDNSTYQKERAAVGGAFTPDTWSAWVRRREATALPGAARFIAQVRSLGGRVVIVTNRTQSECEDTRANFMTLGILVDMMLCRPADTSDKNPRFAAVQNGTAMPGVPALEVVMWVGDNAQDFPSLTQRLGAAPDSAFALFGTRYVVLPNPMYGSWERNPAR